MKFQQTTRKFHWCQWRCQQGAICVKTLWLTCLKSWAACWCLRCWALWSAGGHLRFVVDSGRFQWNLWRPPSSLTVCCWIICRDQLMEINQLLILADTDAGADISLVIFIFCKCWYKVLNCNQRYKLCLGWIKGKSPTGVFTCFSLHFQTALGCAQVLVSKFT